MSFFKEAVISAVILVLLLAGLALKTFYDAGEFKKRGETDCKALTGCDWSKEDDIQRYFKEEIYKNTCFRQFEYVVEQCVTEKSSLD